jgi:long-chain acyl-CoA synthetase
VNFLPALPHSLTGKVSRARLRELGLARAEEEPTASGGDRDR